MRFEDYSFSPVIKKNLALAGFTRPTDIQYKAIFPILKGEDVLAIAQTGTGKTAAFVIPILDMLISDREAGPGIRCMVMEPTRELALQITDVFNSLGKGSRVKTLCVHGGVEQDPQIQRLEKGVDIVVATPGRMFDLVSQGHIDTGQVRILVLDEADHMLDLGFIHDIRQLIRIIPQKRQTLFFSATIDSDIKKLAYSMVKDAIRIQISPKDPVSKNVDHSVAYIGMDDKRFFLERLVKEHPDSRILVFVRTKIRAGRVSEAMERVGIKSLTIHGDKEQKERISALKQFRDGLVKVLIATDVSARGIDIAGVEYVVNYDLPEQPENYVHRVGRTGRGNKRGIAIAFCSPEEKPLLEAIEEYTGNEINTMLIGKNDYQMTVDNSSETKADWKSLVAEAEADEARRKKKGKKK
ncbi:MAG: ATP-dependent RNA helicase RhlE [Bacteroidetes bacterium]|nr:MAG: ATP-dependent RNA helicase RhlE [Bacteroidota bacterium]